MADRTFTLDEANAALREVRPLAEQMVDLRRRHVGAVDRRDELAARIGSNGGGLGPTELRDADAAVDELRQALAHCIDRILELGAQVKDVDTGLLDFPSLRRGEEILLCWRVGEPSIGWWHGLHEGFAGRKPLGSVE